MREKRLVKRIAAVGLTALMMMQGTALNSWNYGEDYAFYRSTLSSINLPESLTTIGISAFVMTHLSSIDLPKGLMNLGSCDFGDCERLESIEIPDSITVIPSGICMSCENLVSVKIPDKVTEIQDSAFAECRKLKNVNIPRLSDSHMSKTSNSGSEDQIGVYKKMEPVIYTADAGYYFPDDYNADGSLNKNGIVVRAMSSSIEISGTPTDTTEITLAPASPYECMITLDANSGKVGDAIAKSFIVKYGQKYGAFSITTMAGCTFEGWYTEKDGGTKVTEDMIVDFTDSKTYYAHWTANKYLLTLSANGGKFKSSTTQKKYVTYGSKTGTLATPTRKGYRFAGWYTAKSRGTKITSATIVKIKTKTTYYAHWKKK